MRESVCCSVKEGRETDYVIVKLCRRVGLSRNAVQPRQNGFCSLKQSESEAKLHLKFNTISLSIRYDWFRFNTLKSRINVYRMIGPGHEFSNFLL